MAVIPPDRLRRDLAALLHRDLDVGGFSLAAARQLRRCVAFDGFCMLTMDPATFLPTGEVSDNALPHEVRARMAQYEIGTDDLNTFDSLTRSEIRVASLSGATGGDLDASPRHRELRAPSGFGDELRAALFSGEAAWGGLSLLRHADAPHFTAADAALLASVSGPLAEGLRRGILHTALSAPLHEDERHAGLVVLAPDNSIARTDAAADRWLAELQDGRTAQPVPDVVAAVASRARSVDASAEPVLARARVRVPSGAWLAVRGSVLGGEGDPWTAVTLEPVRPHELAPIIARAYELTERERAVTQLVARGLATDAIAGRLHISPWTVQDHLKSIFEKVGVNTRGELVGRVFFEHYAPRLSEQVPVGQDGWFESWPGREAAPPVAKTS